MKQKTFCTLFILFIAISIKSQVFLNLDFEKHSSDGHAKGWYQGGEGYNVFVDTTIFYSGKSSMCISQIGSGKFGAATSTFPFEEAKGKSLKYTGYIKTKNVKNGFAGLWWRVDGKSGVLNFDNMKNRGVRGTTDWKKYSIEFKINENPTHINFGVLMSGSGKAWFDKLQIELDGKIYEQIEPKAIRITDEQMTWLKSNINVFDTSDPKHDNSDLSFLKQIVGDAKIVSLGEGTHGTSEFFKMKHRITKYLAEEMGFSVFAIEANMPEAKIVNDYILNGIGDPKKALASLYFWTWNTQEVLDMIEWMREFNKSKKGRIEFWGFDMQTPNVAIEIVEKYFAEHDSSYLPKAKADYDKVIESMNEIRKMKTRPGNVLIEPVLNYANEVLNYFNTKLPLYKTSISNDEAEQVLQNAKIVVQSIECMMTDNISRDESMAANVEWIINHFGKDAKIVLWAHNAHVSKRANQWMKPMGSYLDKKYSKDMIVFGFGFNEGKYTAVGNNGLGIYTTSSSQQGSLERILHQTKKDQFIFDLRKAKDNPLFSFLKDDIEFRSIGAMALDDAFYKTKIMDEFDAIVYFDKTTPSACFGMTNKLK